MTKAETRQLWLAIHRYIGLVTLIFLGIAAVTGCVLAYDKQLDAALNADLFKRPASAAAINPLTAAAALETARPELRVDAVPVRLAPGQTLLLPVEAKAGGKPLGYNQVFVDDNDGHVVGVRQNHPGWDRRHIVEGIFEFHYTLLAGNPGRWLMGLMALAWLVSNLIGLYLTLPLKGPFWANWKKTWQIRTRKTSLPKFMLDLHQASALWLFIGLVVLSFTSVSMNFFSEAFSPIVMAISPARPSPFDKPVTPFEPKPLIGFERALAIGAAQAKIKGETWIPSEVGLHADRNLYRVSFTKSGVTNYSRLGPFSYYFDAADGRLVAEENPYTDSAGLKFSRSLYPLHSGLMGGWIGVAIIFILGLATVEQCISGAYLWLKRRGPRIAGKKALKARKLAAVAAE